MDSVQFLNWISFFSLDRIIINWNKLYDLRNLVGLPVCSWFYWTIVDVEAVCVFVAAINGNFWHKMLNITTIVSGSLFKKSAFQKLLV